MRKFRIIGLKCDNDDYLSWTWIFAKSLWITTLTYLMVRLNEFLEIGSICFEKVCSDFVFEDGENLNRIHQILNANPPVFGSIQWNETWSCKMWNALIDRNIEEKNIEFFFKVWEKYIFGKDFLCPFQFCGLLPYPLDRVEIISNTEPSDDH